MLSCQSGAASASLLSVTGKLVKQRLRLILLLIKEAKTFTVSMWRLAKNNQQFQWLFKSFAMRALLNTQQLFQPELRILLQCNSWRLTLEPQWQNTSATLASTL